MSNKKSNKAIDKNLLYIGVFTIIIIVVIVAVLAINSSNNNNSKNTGANNAQATTGLSVVAENGDKNKTIDTSITVRKINFSKNLKKVKSFEAKQKDTLANPTVATSEDGYTYLSYKFNPKKPATFFGTQVAASDPASMLTYVFKDNNLIEVRIQYGNIGVAGYNSIVASNNSTYGNATYSRTYSNETQQAWWKTKKITLDVICQNGEVIAYYRNNNM